MRWRLRQVTARREDVRLKATRRVWDELVRGVRWHRLMRRLLLEGAWRQLQRGLHNERVEQGIVKRMANMKRNQAWNKWVEVHRLVMDLRARLVVGRQRWLTFLKQQMLRYWHADACSGLDYEYLASIERHMDALRLSRYWRLYKLAVPEVRAAALSRSHCGSG